MKTETIRRKFSVFILSTICLFIFPFFVSNQTIFAEFPNFELTKNNFVVAESFLRTELYFGMNKKDDTFVTEDEWNKFLAEEVTPRFPQGFTSLQAIGQYQMSSGVIVRENTRVIILLYPLNKRKIISRKIEQIRNLYKQKFLQESVLRLDFPQTVRVWF